MPRPKLNQTTIEAHVVFRGREPVGLHLGPDAARRTAEAARKLPCRPGGVTTRVVSIPVPTQEDDANAI